MKAIIMGVFIPLGVASQNKIMLNNISRVLADFDSNDPLMRFLAPLAFGENPGPCPTREEECFTDWDDVPDYMKDITVDNDGDSITLGELINRGKFGIWNFRCESIEFETLSLTTGQSNTYPVTGNIDITELKLDCDMDVRYEDFSFNVDLGFFGNQAIDLGTNDRVKVRLNKGDMGNGGGISFQANYGLSYPNDNDDGEFPNDFDFVGEVGETNGACNIDISDGFEVEANISGNSLIDSFLNLIFSVLISLFQGLIEGIICNVIVQLANIPTDGGETPGIINILITEFNDAIQGYEQEGLQDITDFAAGEEFLLDSLSSADSLLGPDAEDIIENSINFRDDLFFLNLSGLVNTYFDAPSESGGLAVNDVLDNVLGNTDGELIVDDLLTFFQLEEYPTFQFITSAVGLEVGLESFAFRDLNTITELTAAELLTEDTNEVLQYTLSSEFAWENIYFDFGLRLRFLAGEWTQNSDPSGFDDEFLTNGNFDYSLYASDEITFTAALEISNPVIDFTSFSFVDPSLFSTLKVGEVFGPDKTVEEIFHCTASVLPYLNFTGLSLGFSELTEFSIESSSELGEFIEELVTTFNVVAFGGLSTYLPAILENFVRPRLNEQLEQLLTSDDPELCNEYVSTSYNPESFQIADSLTVGFLSYLIDNVIGGDPVEIDSAGNINSIFNAIVTYFAVDENEFFERTTVDDLVTFVAIAREDLVASVDSSNIAFTFDWNGFTMKNLAAFSSMIVNQIEEDGVIDPYSAEVVLKYGDYPTDDSYLPAVFTLPVTLFSRIDNDELANEEFALSVELSMDIEFDVYAEIDKDRTFGSTFEDLAGNLRCWVALLNNQELRTFLLGLIDFRILLEPTDEFSSSNFGQALAALAEEINVAGNNPLADATNILLDRIEAQTIETFNEFDAQDYTVETCASEEPLIGADLSFLGVLLDIPDYIATLNEVMFNSTIDQTETSPRYNQDIEFETYFETGINLNSDRFSFVSLAADAVNGLDVSTLVSSLVELANSTSEDYAGSVFEDFADRVTFVDEEETLIRVNLQMPESISDRNFSGLLEGISFGLSEVNITGLNTLESFEVLGQFESSNYTTSNLFSFETLNIAADIRVTIDIVEVEEVFEEVFVLNIDLDTVSVDTLLTLVMDELVLNNINLYELITFDLTTQTFGISTEAVEKFFESNSFCSLFHQISLPELLISAGSSTATMVTQLENREGTESFFSPAVTEVINTFADIVVQSAVLNFENLSQSSIRRFINSQFDLLITDLRQQTCEETTIDIISDISDEFIVDYDVSPLISQVNDIISELMLPTSPLYINDFLSDTDLVNPNEVVGRINVLQEASIAYNDYDYGEVNAAIGDFNLPDMSITELVFVEGEEEGTYDALRIYFEELEFDMRFAFALNELFQSDDTTEANQPGQGVGYVESFSKGVYNDIRTKFVAQELDITIIGHINIRPRRVLQLTVGDLVALIDNPSRATCLLSLFERGDIHLDTDTSSLEFASLEATAECASICNSPQLVGLQAGATTTSEEVGTLLQLFLAYIDEQLANSDFTWSADDLIDVLILAFESEIDDIGSTCAEAEGINAEQVLDSTQELLSEWIGSAEIIHASVYFFYFGLLIVLSFVLFLFKQYFLHRRIVLNTAIKAHEQEKYDITKDVILQQSRSLYFHPKLPPRAKYILPLGLFVTLVFLISANFFSVGATTVIRFELFGSESVDLNILDFTLESSIDDAWNSGAYYLAVIIALASGFWAYGKIMIMIYTMFAPTTVLSETKRESLLSIIDATGKWSLIDAYVLILLQVAFRTHIENSGQSLDVVVVPKFASLGFILAVCLSLMINNYLVYLHHKVVTPESDGIKIKAERKRLLGYKFQPLVNRSNVSIKVSVGNSTVKLWGLASLAILLIGLFLPIMQFEFSGIAGILLGVIQPDAVSREVSATSIIPEVMNGIPDTIGAYIIALFIQIVYIAFVVFMPIVLVLVLGSLYSSKKVTSEALWTMNFWASTFSAWEAVLVMLVSFLAAVLQVSAMADFIVRAASGNLCEALYQQLLILGIEDRQAKCFNVTATFEPLVVVVLAAGLSLTFGQYVFSKLVAYVVKDRQGEMTEKHFANLLHSRMVKRFVKVTKTDSLSFGEEEIPERNMLATNPVFSDALTYQTPPGFAAVPQAPLPSSTVFSTNPPQDDMPSGLFGTSEPPPRTLHPREGGIRDDESIDI
eukprot:snap_masked-scaffold_4-processed-gene-14.25-mRNA-1 protein AED:1.00 eAED:1.00 QI:0/0/0/0/1/1/2/0/2205